MSLSISSQVSQVRSGWRSLDRCPNLDWENCQGLPDKIVSASSLFGDDADY